jgi:hypothetical protein
MYVLVLIVSVHADDEARVFTPLSFKHRKEASMISVKDYYTEYSEDKQASYVLAEEALNCPVCDSSELIKKGWRSRKLITFIGSLLLFLIQRVRCKDCGKMHHVLPDTIIPYKRYDAETIEAVIKGNPEQALCGLEEQDIYRIKIWWGNMVRYILKKSAVVLTKKEIHISPESKLPAIVRALANAHLWPGTRSVLLAT